MTALEFVRTMKRMCKETTDCGNCGDCIIINYSQCFLARKDFSTEKIVERFEKWAESHPEKTRLDDVIEKHPNSKFDLGYPPILPIMLGYCEERITCEGCPYENESPKKCWDLPLERMEGTT